MIEKRMTLLMKMLLFAAVLMAVRGAAQQDDALSINQANMIGVHTTGNPYSAESVLEKTQTLLDGNRIVQKTTAKHFRDSDGREREELVNDLVGPIIVISDPVAKMTWTLNTRNHTAQETPRPANALKMAQMPSVPTHGSSIGLVIPIPQAGQPPIRGAEYGAYIGGVEKGSAAEKAGMLLRDVVLALNGQSVQDGRDLIKQFAAVPVGSQVTLTVKRQDQQLSFTMTTRDRAEVFKSNPPKEVDLRMRLALEASKLTPVQIQRTKIEYLGTQVMEGLEATGLRYTVPVEAGEIGNERAFEVVNEHWGSRDLGVTMMERHYDPRSGEAVYRLTGIVRGEPDPALFQVPKDFKVIQQTTPALLLRKEE